MKIGEFFVNLGIKGSDKAVKAANDVKGSLGEVSTQGLAAKAGILGAVYALERLMSNSAATGASLVSFANATGLSLESLQRWQYAAAQANVGADEMKNSITGLQSSMINMAMGGGVPKGFGVISNAVGIDQNKIRDTEYMLQKLVEYAGKEKNVDFANSMLESMGLSLDMIAAMRQGVFNKKTMGSAPIYSDSEAHNLQKVNVGWSNLYRQFEMGMGHLNAKHGMALIKALSEISTEVIKLGNALAVFSEKSKVFLLLEDSLHGIVTLLRLVNGESLDQITNEDLAKGNKKHFGDNTWWKNGLNKGIDALIGASSPSVEHAIPRASQKVGNSPQEGGATNTVNMVNHIHGVKDGKDAGHHLKREVDRAGRAIKTKGQGS